MLALSLSIALALFFFLALVVLAVKQFNGQEMKRRLDSFREETEEEEETGEDDLKKIPLYQRTVGRLLAHVMEFLSHFAPSSMPRLMEQRIMLAGKQGIWKVRTVVGLWFFSMVFFGLLGFYYTTQRPWTPSMASAWCGAASSSAPSFPLAYLTISSERDRT